MDGTMGVLRNIFAVLLIPLCAGYTLALLDVIRSLIRISPRSVSFLVGMGFFLLHRRLAARIGGAKKQGFAEVFEHELTHTVVAWLMGSEVIEFQASDKKGGHISHTHTNFIITLAPYFLPTVTVLVLLMAPVIKDEYSLYVVFFAGFTYCYHLLSTWHEFSFHQPDIEKSGKFFSLVFLYLMNVVFVGIVLRFVDSGNSTVLTFLFDGLSQSLTLVLGALSRLM